MTFEEVRFPEAIAYGATGGPEFATDMVVNQGGVEYRNANWAQGRGRYVVSHAIKTQSQLNALLAFFRARKGRAHGFRFKDWTDYSALDEAVGVGNGVETAFQLVKSYSSGSVTYLRTISKPVAGTVVVYVDDVLQSSGVSIDSSSGVIEFDSAPAVDAVITADFEFDVPVRFDVDWLPASIDEYGLYSVQDISLVEIKV